VGERRTSRAHPSSSLCRHEHDAARGRDEPAPRLAPRQQQQIARGVLVDEAKPGRRGRGVRGRGGVGARGGRRSGRGPGVRRLPQRGRRRESGQVQGAQLGGRAPAAGREDGDGRRGAPRGRRPRRERQSVEPFPVPPGTVRATAAPTPRPAGRGGPAGAAAAGRVAAGGRRRGRRRPARAAAAAAGLALVLGEPARFQGLETAWRRGGLGSVGRARAWRAVAPRREAGGGQAWRPPVGRRGPVTVVRRGRRAARARGQAVPRRTPSSPLPPCSPGNNDGLHAPQSPQSKSEPSTPSSRDGRARWGRVEGRTRRQWRAGGGEGGRKGGGRAHTHTLSPSALARRP